MHNNKGMLQKEETAFEVSLLPLILNENSYQSGLQHCDKWSVSPSVFRWVEPAICQAVFILGHKGKTSDWVIELIVSFQKTREYIPWNNLHRVSPCNHSDRQCNYRSESFWSIQPIHATQVGCSCHCTHWGTCQKRLQKKRESRVK